MKYLKSASLMLVAAMIYSVIVAVLWLIGYTIQENAKLIGKTLVLSFLFLVIVAYPYISIYRWLIERTGE